MLFHSLKQVILSQDRLIKQIEYVRGLYRYPINMIGRHFDMNKRHDSTDVLVIAAHPDDDVLGLCSTLYRHNLNGETIKVIFVTNGTAGNGQSWFLNFKTSNDRAKLRYTEAMQALLQINVPKENIYCLGFPDGGTHRYLKNIATDILLGLEKLNPRKVYVHCIEGGHIDHDMTSFVVKNVCHKIGYTNLYEWSEYHPAQPLGTKNVKFLSTASNGIKEISIDISEEERELKKRMLACHKSQDIEQFFMHGEALRQANFLELEKNLFDYCNIPKKRLLPKVNEFMMLFK